jgi:cobalamin biosynthesis protein CobW
LSLLHRAGRIFADHAGITQKRDRIDHIVIETSGLALPKPLVTAFRWPGIRSGATVDGVITVVDCVAVANGMFASDLDALVGATTSRPKPGA